MNETEKNGIVESWIMWNARYGRDKAFDTIHKVIWVYGFYSDDVQNAAPTITFRAEGPFWIGHV